MKLVFWKAKTTFKAKTMLSCMDKSYKYSSSEVTKVTEIWKRLDCVVLTWGHSDGARSRRVTRLVGWRLDFFKNNHPTSLSTSWPAVNNLVFYVQSTNAAISGRSAVTKLIKNEHMSIHNPACNSELFSMHTDPCPLKMGARSQHWPVSGFGLTVQR